MLLLLFFISYINSIKIFLVFSSSINLILVLFSLSLANFIYSIYLLLLLLLFVSIYNISILFFLSYILKFEQISIDFLLIFKYISVKNRYLYIFFLSSIAGLPPIFSFFLKFSIISLFLTKLTNFILLFFILFLFYTIFFYFNISKYILILFSQNNFFKIYLLNSINKNFLIYEILFIFILTFGSLFFFDFIIIIYNLFI